MSIACPHRYISYSRWRLNILSELCATQNHQRPSLLQSLQPQSKTLIPRTGRHYSSEQAPKGESLGASGAEKGKRKTTVTENDTTPAQNPPYTLFDGSDEPRGERHTPDVPRRRPRGKFNPYAQENRRSIRDALETLLELADRGFLAEGSRRVESSHGEPLANPFPWLEAPPLPQSPMLRKTRKKDKPVKEFRSPAEQPLTHDPWARILAEPMRHCKESCVRMPKSLLSEWSFTRHPTSTEGIYLMPSSLANIEEAGMSSRRQERNKQRKLERHSAEDRYIPIENDGYLDRLANHRSESESSDAKVAEGVMPQSEPRLVTSLENKPDQAGRARVIRILLYDNILSLFSLHNLGNKKRRSLASRLIPPIWMRGAEEARHYEQARKVFADQTGQEQSAVPSSETTIDLNNIRWQNDIGERLLKILRERVLVAVGRSFAQEADRRKGLTSVLAMSKVKAALGERHKETASSSAGDLLATETNSSGSPPSEAARGHMHPAEDRALQPRFLLHLGHSRSLQELDMPEGNDMIPPLLPSVERGTSQRFPVFPARAMLGDSGYEKLLHLVREHNILNEEKIKRLVLEGHDYLLMFKLSTTTEAIEGLLTAVWRLWRYGGGMRWTKPDDEKYEGWKEMLTELDKLLAAEKTKVLGAPGDGSYGSMWDVREEEEKEDEMEEITAREAYKDFPSQEKEKRMIAASEGEHALYNSTVQIGHGKGRGGNKEHMSMNILGLQ